MVEEVTRSAARQEARRQARGPPEAPGSRSWPRDARARDAGGHPRRMALLPGRRHARGAPGGHEFGFKVRAFHHALEAYKIRDVLARRRVAIATWDDWWGFKMEAYDGIPENLALMTEAGGRAALH